MSGRRAEVERRTKETEISVAVDLDGSGRSEISTGLRFLDHMLDALTRHSRMDVTLACKGDLDIDDHHTAEDCGLALGEAVGKALGERKGIRRFGSAHAPLDEALARAVVDISGRPHGEIDMGLQREKVGDIATEMLPHVIHSFAMKAGMTIHVDVLKGENDHHRAEAAFKALALALRMAMTDEGTGEIPSTKGTL